MGIRGGWISRLLVCVVLSQSVPTQTQAAPSFPLDQALNDLSSFLSPAVVNSAVKTIGLLFDNRPYEPASPLGTKIGLDFGIEAEVVEISPELSNALKDAGFNITLPPFFASAREINLHKGISERADIGGSLFMLLGYTIWSVDFKLVVFQPEEGPTWAVRLGYTSSHVPVGSTTVLVSTFNVDINTVTWNPEIVVSKTLGYAEPYIGVGYEYVQGSVGVTQSGGPPVPGLTTKTGTGGSFLSFLGLSLKSPVLGLRLTLEGAYSAYGFNSVGTKFGFSF